MPTLYVMHGFIGAGKTTFSRLLAAKKNAVRFTQDEWMAKLFGATPENFQENYNKVRSLVYDLASQVLGTGTDVIFDWGAWNRDDRNTLRDFAKANDAEIIFYYLKCDTEVALQRNLKRKSDEQPLEITRETFLELRKRFSPVEPDEPHILIDTTSFASPADFERFI